MITNHKTFDNFNLNSVNIPERSYWHSHEFDPRTLEVKFCQVREVLLHEFVFWKQRNTTWSWSQDLVYLDVFVSISPVFAFSCQELFPHHDLISCWFVFLMVSYHGGLFIFSWSNIISWSDIACYRTSPRPTSNFRHLWNIVTLSNMFPTKTKSPSKSSFTSAITVNIFFLVNINLFYGDFFLGCMIWGGLFFIVNIFWGANFVHSEPFWGGLFCSCWTSCEEV